MTRTVAGGKKKAAKKISKKAGKKATQKKKSAKKFSKPAARSAKNAAKKKAAKKAKPAAGKKKSAAKKATTKTAGKAKSKATAAPTTQTAAPGPAAERMRTLEKEIRHHQQLYYQKNQPEISDRDFDRLFAELQKLEKKYPDDARPDSPTQVVGSDLENEFPKFQHTIPVLSLGNTYSPEEALEWSEKHAAPHDTKVGVQWKVDGATLVLYYEAGRLVRAVTRGTGQVGDEVTANALTIKDVPRTLKEKVTLAARGEVYMTFADFAEYNESIGWVYANPRNLAAGTLKHKKPAEVAKRPLRWVAFEGHFDRDYLRANKIKSDEAVLRKLKKLGLPVSPDNRFVKVEKLPDEIETFTAAKESVPMPVDGLVLKVEDLELRERLGFTANNPRWATSLKFEPELGQTTVEDIELQVGRTGRVTPRARLAPVQLAGTTVTYATLHNADYIKKLGVRKGSLVKVSKRGEIIPAVEEVVDPGKGRAYRFPKKCPACKTGLQREDDAVDWMCPNPECPEKQLNRLVFFAGRKQMDIAGLGERVMEILFEQGYVKRVPDIYGLHEHRAKLETIEGFGEKSVRILLDGIEASKQREFRYVLPALGLREVATHVTGILITEGYDSIDRIIELATAENAEEILAEMDGVGPRTAEAILEQFQDPEILGLIDELKAAGLQMAVPERAEGPGFPQIFAGQSWCVTGSFAEFRPRDLAMEAVRLRGGRIVTGVSSKTTHLLAGDGAGSKLAKAEKLGVTVVSETEFLELLA
ncbi:MAG: NAD-dependent DNA ligase LigA [bacterium]|nr:NAD-dependent DNA ligase LigA [bacterium]